MPINHFAIESHPAVTDVQFLEDRLYEYNVGQTGVDDGQQFPPMTRWPPISASRSAF